MKQHIEWEQFIELNFEQVIKLQKLIDQRYHLVKDSEHWEEIRSHKYVTGSGEVFNIHTSYTGFLDKTNIGKMIEILQHKYWITLEQNQGENHSWHVVLYDKEKNTLYHQFHVAKKELCDALFEAIKEVL